MNGPNVSGPSVGSDVGRRCALNVNTRSSLGTLIHPLALLSHRVVVPKSRSSYSTYSYSLLHRGGHPRHPAL